jgi:hypothetical protein
MNARPRLLGWSCLDRIAADSNRSRAGAAGADDRGRVTGDALASAIGVGLVLPDTDCFDIAEVVSHQPATPRPSRSVGRCGGLCDRLGRGLLPLRAEPDVNHPLLADVQHTRPDPGPGHCLGRADRGIAPD